MRKQMTVDGEPAIIEILDTAGQEEYKALWHQQIRSGEGYVVVYDVTDRESFAKLDKIYMVGMWNAWNAIFMCYCC